MTFTRREVLTAFLGAPLALAACRRESSRRVLPPGEIVGTSVGIGHRLRDGWRPRPSDDAWKQVGVAIVGGGVAGLAAAWRLRRAGIDDFLVCELEPRAGGTARSGESAVTRFPWGAHYVPAPTHENRTLVALLGEMGLLDGIDAHGDPIVQEQALVRDPQERIFYRGTWYEGLYLHAGASREDLRQFAEFRGIVNEWVAWRDRRGRRAFTIPVAGGSDDAEVTALDRISMRELLDRRGLTSPRLRWLVDYACRDDYGSHPEQTSAWAGLFYFASRVPAASAESEPLIAWPEGNGRFVEHFLQRIGARVAVSTAVTEIVTAKNAIEVITASADGRRITGYRARHVIFAAPQFLVPRIIPALPPERAAVAHEFTYGSWLVANVALRDRLRERTFPLAWDNVFYESPSLGYVVATHQLDRDRGPTVLTYYYAFCDADPVRARTRMLSTGREEWADVVLSDLGLAHPDIRELATKLDIMRWGHAMVRPRPGFVWGPARREAAKPFEGIHFAHTDLSGVALFEEALHHGVRAAEEILADRGELSETLL
ncbi:MAG TPA: FAD-dependent oxidoreductase [Thermoanaerobaculia bacterium]|nr:FAD-dependent oxidoreductase [Thermoanaerobaculia bacterium]